MGEFPWDRVYENGDGEDGGELESVEVWLWMQMEVRGYGGVAHEGFVDCLERKGEEGEEGEEDLLLLLLGLVYW